MSPILFNILISDFHLVRRRDGKGKVRWGSEIGGGESVFPGVRSDIVLLTEDEGSMRSLLERLENYLDRKGLQLNTEKTKVVRFRREGGRLRKVEWMWKGNKRE